MAAPITNIKKTVRTEEEIKQAKLEELQSLLAEQDEAIENLLELTGELNDSGIIEALNAMVKTRETIAKIAVEQTNRDPIKNLINHAINASAAISSISPEVTEKLTNGLKSGIAEAEQEMLNDSKVSLFSLMKALNDPDVNRAVTFGLHFLKGMGKGIEKDY